MAPLRKFLPILVLLTMSACATPERPRTVADTTCTVLAPLTFAQLPKGKTDDPGNKADTGETVAQIMAHNAKWGALCG